MAYLEVSNPCLALQICQRGITVKIDAALVIEISFNLTFNVCVKEKGKKLQQTLFTRVFNILTYCNPLEILLLSLDGIPYVYLLKLTVIAEPGHTHI